ncbi:MAG: hypothetical protein LBN10_10070 [Propionibacteriaceae bacterium]|nr:hypothetical protein [Propionibacteriaceae bacterium]
MTDKAANNQRFPRHPFLLAIAPLFRDWTGTVVDGKVEFLQRQEALVVHVRGTWLNPLAALAAFILACAGVLVCLPTAHAAAQATVVVLADVTPGPVTTTISGSFAKDNNDPLAGFSLTVSVDGKNIGKATTDSTGSFQMSFNNPDAGDHSVVVMWPGDAQYLRSSDSLSFHIAPPPKPTTVLTATLDPATANPGTTIAISGALTSSTGSGVSLARVTVTLSWGDVSSMTVTGDEGKYDIVLSLPQTSDFPSSLDILVEYAGDNVYESSSVTAKLPLKATPTPTPTPSASSTSSTATPTAKASTAPTNAPTVAPVSAAQSMKDNPNLMLGLIIVLGVAVAAILTLLIVGIVSNRRHRLAADERRGFGSDFGLKNQ